MPQMPGHFPIHFIPATKQMNRPYSPYQHFPPYMYQHLSNRASTGGSSCHLQPPSNLALYIVPNLGRVWVFSDKDIHDKFYRNKNAVWYKRNMLVEQTNKCPD